jgi:hypothetical protein
MPGLGHGDQTHFEHNESAVTLKADLSADIVRLRSRANSGRRCQLCRPLESRFERYSAHKRPCEFQLVIGQQRDRTLPPRSELVEQKIA